MRWAPSNLMIGFLRAKRTAGNVKEYSCALDDIRMTMLELMGDRCAQAFPVLHVQVTYANNVEDLWYLRGDVMVAIASFDGEVIARDKLTKVTSKFKGLLPDGLNRRPSTLSQ
jgi:hypothetical protein